MKRSTWSMMLTRDKFGSVSAWAAVGCIFLLVLQLELAFSKSINWDEYFHLSQIHAYRRGEDVQWLQTPHVLLFSWLPEFVAQPIEQVSWARALLLPLVAITALAIWDTGRHLTDSASAAIATLAWLGAGYVFLQSFALRADIIAACLLTVGIWAIVTVNNRLIAATVMAFFACLAFVATVKSLLYAPAFFAVLVWRFKSEIGFRPIIVIATFAILAGAALVLFGSEYLRDIVGLLGASFDRMFSAGLFPQSRYLVMQIIMAPIFSAMVVVAIWYALKREENVPTILVLGLTLPLLSVVVYRNSYPYFYAFILPPLAIAASWGAQKISQRYAPKLLILLVLIGAIVSSLSQSREMMDKQRVAQAGLSQIFPEPVRYMDDIAFRPDFPRAVPYFASGWALEHYRRRGESTYAQAMANPPTPMLFRQGYALEELDPKPDDEFALLPEDARALRQNYIEHWGRVFVAGKIIQASDQNQSMSISIPGTYTIERTPIEIDGETFNPGETIDLSIGEIELGPVRGDGAILRWGDNLVVPDYPFPDGQLFTDY